MTCWQCSWQHLYVLLNVMQPAHVQLNKKMVWLQHLRACSNAMPQAEAHQPLIRSRWARNYPGAIELLLVVAQLTTSVPDLTVGRGKECGSGSCIARTASFATVAFAHQSAATICVMAYWQMFNEGDPHEMCAHVSLLPLPYTLLGSKVITSSSRAIQHRSAYDIFKQTGQAVRLVFNYNNIRKIIFMSSPQRWSVGIVANGFISAASHFFPGTPTA